MLDEAIRLGAGRRRVRRMRTLEMSLAREAQALAARAAVVVGRLPDEVWATVQASVPVACVDLVGVRGTGVDLELCLIRRPTPSQGERWALIGGRLWRGEDVRAAITRQVRETLGPYAVVLPLTSAAPLVLAEYTPYERPDGPFDPRQHAIGLTYTVRLAGELTASGEASEFHWFRPDGLPPQADFGFGQWAVLADILDTFGEQAAAARLRQS